MTLNKILLWKPAAHCTDKELRTRKFQSRSAALAYLAAQKK